VWFQIRPNKLDCFKLGSLVIVPGILELPVIKTKLTKTRAKPPVEKKIRFNYTPGLLLTNLMLVSFFIYLSPRMLISSILNLSVLVPLKADSTFELVKGDGLDLAGSVGDILVLQTNQAVVLHT
jgi:hypothetical protein